MPLSDLQPNATNNEVGRLSYIDHLLSCRKSSGINFYIAVAATNVMICHLVHVPTIISQSIIPLPLFNSFELRTCKTYLEIKSP